VRDVITTIMHGALMHKAGDSSIYGVAILSMKQKLKKKIVCDLSVQVCQFKLLLKRLKVQPV
jgi:hypothetical protein